MYREKNKKLEDHITLVMNERKLTEQLKLEIDKEIADSEHFIKMAEQENWRTASDYKRLINQKNKLTSRISSIEVRFSALFGKSFVTCREIVVAILF